MSSFLLHFGSTVLLPTELSFFSPWELWIYASTAFVLQGVWRDVHWWFHWGSFVHVRGSAVKHSVLLFSCFFQESFSVFSFDSLIVVCLGVGLGLMILNSHQKFLNLYMYASLCLGDFQLFLLQISIPLYFSSFWGGDNEHSSLLTDVALVPEALFTFLHSFSLFFPYSVI